MKTDTLSCSLLSAVLFCVAAAGVQAGGHDDNGQGIQGAIDQHDKNIQRYRENHPDKEIPKGLLHSRAVLERISAGERPELPGMAMRPERPELPDVARRPDRPEKPTKPNVGRR